MVDLTDIEAAAVSSRLICAGCGWEAPAAEPYPFRCPRTGEDVADHVMTPVLDLGAATPPEGWRRVFLDPEPEPFLRYRRLVHAWHAGRARGLSDAAYVALVEGLDAAVAAVDGRGFRETPFAPNRELARRLGLGGGEVWVKDETGNVSGSHKARHLMGVAIWLAGVAEAGSRRRDGEAAGPRLAIASCGNAALAAAVVARAAGWPLEVFIPPEAHPAVVARLEGLGATLAVCPRQAGAAGDPCYHRFREAVDEGALPFTCQGSENGLVIEGGQTLAWEMVSALLRQGGSLDRLFVQVGGGALASAVFQGLEKARDLGLIGRLPRLHAVQTQGCHPLRRAWEQLAEGILNRWWRETRETLPIMGDEERAKLIAERVPPRLVAEEIRYAATHRPELMWPWEEEPRSLATGILDDETYDWLAVVRGMVTTGGYPVVVSEERLREAWELARETTGVPADPTGTAGLAGCLDLVQRQVVGPEETVAVLLTGVER